MRKLLRASTIAAIGNDLAIAWEGGGESYIPLETLRRACPCAACAGEPDALGLVERPQVSHGPRAFELAGWEFVGGYGFQPVWGDGHRTGIFSWIYLRQVAEQAGAA